MSKFMKDQIQALINPYVKRKNLKRLVFFCLAISSILATYSLTGCYIGGDNDGNGDKTEIGLKPGGLRIFVSASLHHGDFANDPTLFGQTAMEKADDFCMQDANLPADGLGVVQHAEIFGIYIV